MPTVRGDGMRGLAVFISDIRNCELKYFSLYYIVELCFQQFRSTEYFSNIHTRAYCYIFGQRGTLINFWNVEILIRVSLRDTMPLKIMWDAEYLKQ